MTQKQSFSLIAIYVFSLSMLAPFAYAAPQQDSSPILYFADPTPTATPAPVATATPTTETVGSCVISQMDSAEGKRFVDAVFGQEGQELTDRSDAKIKASNPASTPLQINNNIYNFPAEESVDFMTVKEYAQLTGLTEEFIAEQLGLSPDPQASPSPGASPLPAIPVSDQKITIAQARAVAAASPDKEDMTGKLNAFLSSKGKSKASEQVKVPGFTQYKIKLPNGKEIPLDDLYRYQQLQDANGNAGSCLLGNTNIQGKVTYYGVLNQNLLLAADKAPASLEHNQHLSTNGLKATIRDYAGNVVIPSFYEKAINAIGFYSRLDWMVGAATLLYSASNIQRATKEFEAAEKHAERTRSVQIPRVETQAPADMPAFPRPGATAQEMSDYKAAMSAWEQTPSGQSFAQDMAQKTQNLEIQQAAQDAADAATAAQGRLNELNRNVGFFERRFWSSFTMGLAWLGPARFALQLANQISFTTPFPATTEKGQALEIYAGNGEYSSTFRRRSDIMGLGLISDAFDSLTSSGIPAKIFRVDNLLFIQSPGDTGTEKYSQTTISKDNIGGWTVSTQWRGNSDLSALEDIHDGRKVTSLAVRSRYLALGGTIERKDEYADYYKIILMLAPILTWKLIPTTSEQFRPVAAIFQIQTTQWWISNFVDPSTFSDKDECSDAKLNGWLFAYKTAVVASALEQIALGFGPQLASTRNAISAFLKLSEDSRFLRTSSSISSTVSNVYPGYMRFTQFFDPITFAKSATGSKVLAYASACKDPEYKILAFKRLETTATVSSLKKMTDSAKQKANDPLGINGLVSSLNVGQLFAGVGQKPAEVELKEALSVKALLQDQTGVVKPSSLNYLHLDPQSASMSWFDVYDANQCFRDCTDMGGKFCCVGQDGVTCTDKKTGEKTYLADKDRGLMSDFIPGLGLVVPNKLISTQLYCPGNPVMRVDGEGRLTVLAANCPAMACTMESLSRVGGINIGSDLSKSLGKVRAIYTTQARGVPIGGTITMFRTTGAQTNNKLVPGSNPSNIDGDRAVNANANTGGKETSGATEYTSLAGREYSVSSLEIFGNPKVRVSGSEKPEDQYGELRTIECENGVVHYDAATRKLHVALKVLAMVPARDITGITAKPAEVAASKADYAAQDKRLVELMDKLATNQKLTQEELELLRRSLDRPTPTGAGLTSQEKAVLNAALAKQSSGKPLSQVEQDVLQRAQAQEKYPGVVILNPAQQSTIDRALKETNSVPVESQSTIRETLREGKPLTTEQKNQVATALDAAVEQKAVSAAEAEALKKAIEGTVAPTARASEIANAVASGTPLSSDQREAAITAVSAERQRLGESAATAQSKAIPGIELGGATAKAGGEDNARDLNTALKQIGALSTFVTENKALGFTTDEAGNSVVKIADKATGKVDEFKITGPLTKEGNAIVAPTDKGPVKVDVGVNPANGQPVITINAPNNINEKAPLVMAQGLNGGLLYYDPTTGTWQVRNGLAIPTDSQFGKNGASFYGSADGTRAIPTSDAFGYQPPATSYQNGGNPLLALPSWPETMLAMVLMLALVFIGVLSVRYRRF